jgi:hypothetical protein
MSASAGAWLQLVESMCHSTVHTCRQNSKIHDNVTIRRSDISTLITAAASSGVAVWVKEREQGHSAYNSCRARRPGLSIQHPVPAIRGNAAPHSQCLRYVLKSEDVQSAVIEKTPAGQAHLPGCAKKLRPSDCYLRPLSICFSFPSPQ